MSIVFKPKIVLFSPQQPFAVAGPLKAAMPKATIFSGDMTTVLGLLNPAEPKMPAELPEAYFMRIPGIGNLEYAKQAITILQKHRKLTPQKGKDPDIFLFACPKDADAAAFIAQETGYTTHLFVQEGLRVLENRRITDFTALHKSCELHAPPYVAGDSDTPRLEI